MSLKTNNPTPDAGETEVPAIPKDGKTPGRDPDGKHDDRPASESVKPSEVDEPHAGSPDREAGRDDFRQRPITDNKAGG